MKLPAPYSKHPLHGLLGVPTTYIVTMHTPLKHSLMAATLAISITAQAQAPTPAPAPELGPEPAPAPTPAAPIPDELVQAVRKAVTTNPEVQARWNVFLASDSQRDIAKAGYLPQLDVSASAGRQRSESGGINQGTYNIASGQLSLKQMLFDGFFTRSEVQRLGAAKRTRYYELLEASETAALEATRAYADVVRYRALVDLATQNYAEHKQSALLVEERANAGVGRRVDVEQANGRLALAESNLLTELTNLHDVSARYLRVVGEKPAAVLPSLPEPFTLGALPANSDTLMRDGMRGSPTLLAAIENARSNRIAIASARAGYYPRVDLQMYGNQNRNLGGTLGDSHAQGVAVSITYNLFRGGADRAKEKQAVSLSEQALDLQEKACRDVRQTLSLAYSDARSLNEQLGYRDRHRLATEKSREAYRQQFDIGQRTLLDLLDTQNEFFEASRSYVNARHDQATAQARTLAAMGTLTAALGVHRPDLPNSQSLGMDAADVDPATLCPLEESVVESLEKIKAATVIPTRAKAALPQPLPLSQPLPLALTPVPSSNAAPAEKPAARRYLINFLLGKDDLLPQSTPILNTLLNDYRNTPAAEVNIVGHADKVGNATQNLKLSERRAKKVSRLLTKDGAVTNSRIQEAWRGDKDPLPGTEAAEEVPANRRVEVDIK